ncbi:single-stranded DNA-binding protein, mitochondrial [Nicotiana tabacum]|uniref:Single-stranded DNA-binding protein, mitochondrial n=2 Tax=Nicotiana TaxID=4085 RepID=A0A1S4C7W5_TOBAC|nr:PREDICTED: single-stranded DNA-binding protein, mitochondrial [Nicotiana sylvestris]XP_016497196.1 PREDICTED: single-stranded DNA-binding protein, mitochondrial-like [Nicotiana tabacum]
MASSLSRKLLRTMLTNPISIKASQLSSFCTKISSATEDFSSPDADRIELESASDAEPESTGFSSPSASDFNQERKFVERPLENGLEVGIYKAILVGQVGQTPIQKKLKSGRTVTLLSLGTGGIRNNRRPFDNEEPREYANRCAVQWHRVSVYPERLGEMAMKSIVPGSILYVEGNLESKIFTDPITGLVRRIREVAVRRNGRLVFLGNGNEAQQPSQAEIKGVGYY